MMPRMRGDQSLERWGTAAALLAWVAVGVPVVTGDLVESPGGWWWAAYLVFGLLLIVEIIPGLAPAPPIERLLLAAQLVVGAAVFVLDGGYGFSSVLLIVNAATAALLLRLGGAVAVVAAQTVLIVMVHSWRGHGSTEFLSLTQALAFAGFQVFAVAMIVVAQRERRARTEATALAVELAAAQTRLADASRNAERLRIARDVHDTLGHGLTALAMNLEVARHQVSGPAAEHVERARRLVTDTLTELRDLVSRTREPDIELAPALHRMFEDVPGLTVELSIDPDLRVADTCQAEAVLRCAQEVLTNTLRHARATRLWVDVTRTADGVTVRAHDDGRGPARVDVGHGLTGMRERFEELGGTVVFGAVDGTDSGAGFRVEATLPTAGARR